MKSKLKIGFLSYYDSDLIHYWSGSIYFMRKSIERENTLVVPIHKLYSKLDDIYKIKSLFYKWTGKKYHRPREISINKRLAHLAEKHIKETKPDVILSSGALEIAHIETKIPLTFWSDATLNNLVNYYPDYTNLAKETFISADYLEKLALKNATKQFFTSKWASDDSINYYYSDPSKVVTIPFGANIVSVPSYEEVKNNIYNKKFDEINFLFVGVDWYRKGGDISQKLVEKLRKNGVNAKLNVVGCQPQIESIPNYVNVYGYLNKRIEADYKKLIELYQNAHFFIMPSRFEAFGVVVCEANANGLPVIASKTGGLQHIVKNGLNGYLFDYNDENQSIDYLSNMIIELLSNKDKYTNFALSSYHEYSTNLNWDSAGSKVVDELFKLV